MTERDCTTLPGQTEPPEPRPVTLEQLAAELDTPTDLSEPTDEP